MILRNVNKSRNFNLTKHVKLVRNEKKLLFNASLKQMSVVTLNNCNNKIMINNNKIIFNNNCMINVTINVNKSEYHVLNEINSCNLKVISHFKITSLHTILFVIMKHYLETIHSIKNY